MNGGNGMQEIEHHPLYSAWSELKEFPGRGEVKLLRDEPHCGAKTMLVRLPPGGRIEPHTHVGVVQHFVVEGEYHTDGRTFERGAYRLLPKQADVAPITTNAGVTILIIYDPAGA
jgi:anti-sigma factor ChrR (cupin superfamily)